MVAAIGVESSIGVSAGAQDTTETTTARRKITPMNPSVLTIDLLGEGLRVPQSSMMTGTIRPLEEFRIFHKLH